MCFGGLFRYIYHVHSASAVQSLYAQFDGGAAGQELKRVHPNVRAATDNINFSLTQKIPFSRVKGFRDCNLNVVDTQSELDCFCLEKCEFTSHFLSE